MIPTDGQAGVERRTGPLQCPAPVVPAPTDAGLTPTRLREASFSEGNLLEHPIFQLSNKGARPKRANGLVDPDDYVVEHILDARRKLVVRADVHSGLPTFFAYRVLLAVLHRARALDWSQRVPIGRAEICHALKIAPSGSAYGYIDHAFSALRGLTLVFYESWWDAKAKVHPGIREEQLIKTFQFCAESHSPPKPTHVMQRLAARQQGFTIREQFVELGDGLIASCRAGYFVGVDCDYINDLPTDTCRRLYAYLTKRDGGEAPFYTESLEKLARKFPLARTKPTYVRRSLEPALKVLAAPLAPSGRKFLRCFTFDAASRLVVEFEGRALPTVRAAMYQHLRTP